MMGVWCCHDGCGVVMMGVVYVMCRDQQVGKLKQQIESLKEQYAAMISYIHVVMMLSSLTGCTHVKLS